jgi:CBS domain-containing protein
MKVEDLMCTEARICGEDDALSEAGRVMAEHDCGIVPVLHHDGSGRLVGVITDRDICLALCRESAKAGELQVKRVMTRAPKTCRPGDPIGKAVETMASAQVRRLPVVDEAGHLRGLLSLADLAEAARGDGRAREQGPQLGEAVARALGAICRPRSAVAPPME